MPATVEVLDLIASVRERGVPVLFDVDDLIFDPDVAAEIPALEILPAEEAELWLEGVRRYRTTMEACDAFVGTTPALCRHATEVTGMPARQFANGVGVLLGQASDDALRAEPPAGSAPDRLPQRHQHPRRRLGVRRAGDRRDPRPPPGGRAVAGRAGHAVGRPSSPFGDRVVRLPFLPWRELPGVLRDIDVNLAPLAPGSRFNEAKSAIKWLEAALVETPTVASPTEPFREAIAPAGVDDGLLAATPEEWVEAIDRLLVDDDLRPPDRPPGPAGGPPALVAPPPGPPLPGDPRGGRAAGLPAGVGLGPSGPRRAAPPVRAGALRRPPVATHRRHGRRRRRAAATRSGPRRPGPRPAGWSPCCGRACAPTAPVDGVRRVTRYSARVGRAAVRRLGADRGLRPLTVRLRACGLREGRAADLVGGGWPPGGGRG